MEAVRCLVRWLWPRWLPTALAGLVLAALAAAGSAQEAPLIAGSEGVPVPKRTKMVKPEYPAEAQARGLRGIVILDLTIDAEGKVTAVELIRSIPGLDEAAVAAVKKWEYEPVKIGGKAVAVKLTVPITFLMHLPDITRQEGIPELRQGAVPAFPAGADARGSAEADLTVDPEGHVLEAAIRGGNPPFTEALLQAIRTWFFAPDPSRGLLSFRVVADFGGGDRGQPRVALRLSEPRERPIAAIPAEPAPAAATAEPAASAAAPPAAEPSRAPSAPPPAATVAPVAPPGPGSPEAVPGPPAAAAEPAAQVPGAVPAPAPQPATEILRAPAEAPQPSAPAVSAVRDVSLGVGIPELTKGRRPVPPPFARIARVTGTVLVRFAIDAAGSASVQGADGPEGLRLAAEQVVVSWVFRRTSTDRLRAVAEFTYREDQAVAAVRLEP